MLKLQLIRYDYTKDYTHGSLAFWNGERWEEFSHTLEDPTRDKNKDGDLQDQGEKKIYGKTAIPFGKYDGFLRFSPSRKRLLPQLKGVKHFDYIQIHSGNTVKDTEGCILVGFEYKSGKIWKSRDAERLLTRMIEDENGVFEIEII
jgi:hypothetical protein